MLHTKTCNRLLIIQLLFFSSKAGKAKRIKKRSARSRSVKQVFLQYKVTNCTMSYNTCTLFARIYTLLCAVVLLKLYFFCRSRQEKKLRRTITYIFNSRFGRLQSTSNRRNIDHIVKGNKENQYAKKERVASLCTDCFDRFTCNPCDLTTSRTFCISLLA